MRILKTEDNCFFFLLNYYESIINSLCLRHIHKKTIYYLISKKNYMHA
jgi:hypothetical protein